MGSENATERPRRYRFRLSTLMLLIIIAGLFSYIVADHWNRAREMRRLALPHQRAEAAERMYLRGLAALHQRTEAAERMYLRGTLPGTMRPRAAMEAETAYEVAEDAKAPLDQVKDQAIGSTKGKAGGK
jgi:hypothetical protein